MLELKSRETLDYTLLQKCGSGAFGEVWTAKYKYDDTLYALKILRKNFSGSIQKETQAFVLYKERVSYHPNLIHIHSELLETDSELYYTMDLADNISTDPNKFIPDTLANRMKFGHNFSKKEIIKIISDILKGLQHLHQSSLSHRDVKPENILFINGVAILGDIGILNYVSTHLTKDIGTNGYIPPEGWVNEASDFYSVGKVLYTLLTGLDIEKYPSLAKISPKITMQEASFLNEVINKACSKNPEKRFEKAYHFRNNLKDNRKKINKTLKKSLYFVLIAIALFLSLFVYNEYNKVQLEGLNSIKEKLAASYATPEDLQNRLLKLNEKYPNLILKSKEYQQAKKYLNTLIKERNIEMRRLPILLLREDYKGTEKIINKIENSWKKWASEQDEFQELKNFHYY